ncbi:flagellar biosynthesis protein FliQ [Proteiniclasticum sp. BAD-10]|jgi:flagellar biosynthetic protein FliQ|uniref:Flagellar biosynthetic protein FliQ n=1 Tax=Proteiniclasticum sediminis TaxID=2804028 RepID=A0A941CQJ5_9CLOT|nr:flagellar biosynthesis protein FliQ [Proteiniclasticum sediminis]MBR0575948.1 flagellar biosynthesis protein FliQ [Proteiniclasticum sediminis]
MNQTMALDLMRNAFMATLKASLPILLIAMIVGLIISVLQATTQVQEQTLSFVPKLVAVLFSLILFGSFMMNVLVSFLRESLELLPKL